MHVAINPALNMYICTSQGQADQSASLDALIILKVHVVDLNINKLYTHHTKNLLSSLQLLQMITVCHYIVIVIAHICTYETPDLCIHT